jgi:chemotaxis protein MotB
MTGMLMVFVLLFCFVMISLKQTEAKIKPTPTPQKNHVELKKKIIAEITAELRKHHITVVPNEKTGDINIKSDVFFQSGKATLSQKGKEFLDEFAPNYFGILSKPKYISEISDILIEGHTDLVGNDISNMRLSQERANAAYEYIFGKKRNIDYMKIYNTTKGKVSTVGYGKHKARDINYISKDDSKLRRISFKFRLTYEVINE